MSFLKKFGNEALHFAKQAKTNIGNTKEKVTGNVGNKLYLTGEKMRNAVAVTDSKFDSVWGSNLNPLFRVPAALGALAVYGPKQIVNSLGKSMSSVGQNMATNQNENTKRADELKKSTEQINNQIEMNEKRRAYLRETWKEINKRSGYGGSKTRRNKRRNNKTKRHHTKSKKTRKH